MATKPTDVGRFAVDGSDVDATNISAPSSGLRDTGFPNNYVPPAAEFNYLENVAYRWRNYLNGGAFQGASSFDSTLSVGAPLVVPDFVFTAANGSDTYTSVAHGLLTGDGPVRVVNSGGALPAGLVAATDYWVIRLTADTFKLATTLALALAGTPLNITTDGTGTQTLQDTGSTKRRADLVVDGNTTINDNLSVLGSYGAISASTLVTSGTVIATGSVTGSDIGHGQRFKAIPSWAFQNLVPGATTPTLDDLAGDGSPDGWRHWSSGDKVIAWIPLDAGDTVADITWSYAKASSSAAMVFEVVDIGDFGTITVVDTFTDTSSGVGFITTTRTLSYTISPTHSISLRVSSSTAAHIFQNARIVWHRTV